MIALISGQTRFRPQTHLPLVSIGGAGRRAALRLLVPLLALTALPAFADEDTLGQGLGLCLTRMTDPVALAEAAIPEGRVPQESSGNVATYAKGRVILYLPLDGSGCTLVADGVATDWVRPVVGSAMATVGIAAARDFQTEMGCPAIELSDGRIVTWNGAGPDPACDSDIDSATTIYVPGS